MARGHGPKGWRRSDERILEEFCERVVRGGLDAGDVEVSCRDGALRLEGRVGSEEDRARLEELASAVLGVLTLDSDLRVDGEEEDAGPDPETRH